MLTQFVHSPVYMHISFRTSDQIIPEPLLGVIKAIARPTCRFESIMIGIHFTNSVTVTCQFTQINSNNCTGRNFSYMQTGKNQNQNQICIVGATSCRAAIIIPAVGVEFYVFSSRIRIISFNIFFAVVVTLYLQFLEQYELYQSKF